MTLSLTHSLSHWVTHWLTEGTFTFDIHRATSETCDLCNIWSESLGDMTWPKIYLPVLSAHFKLNDDRNLLFSKRIKIPSSIESQYFFKFSKLLKLNLNWIQFCRFVGRCVLWPGEIRWPEMRQKNFSACYSAGTLVQPNTEELISELLVGQNFWRSLTCPKMARYIAWFSWKSPSTHFWCNWKQATLPTSSPGGSRRVTDVFLGQFGKVCEIVFLCSNSSVFVSPKLIFSSMLYIQYSSMV